MKKARALRLQLLNHISSRLALLALVCAFTACGTAAVLGTIKVAGKEVSDPRRVRVERKGTQLWAAAAMSIAPGDTISTDVDTTLVLRLGDARAVLMPNTKVSFGSVFTWFGRVFISGWLQGKTKLVNGAVKGTQYVVEVDEKSGLTTFSVLEGTVHVNSVKGLFPELVLTAAQRVRVLADMKQSPTIEAIERGDYNALIQAANGARDAALDELLLPDVTGTKAKDAEAMLREAGFEVSKSLVVAPSPDAVGLIADQVPRAGTATLRVELQEGRSFQKGADKVHFAPPNNAEAGGQLSLNWTGPNANGDKVVLVPSSTPDGKYHPDLELSARGGRGELRVPAEPGTYELRYLPEDGSAVLARTIVVVTPVTAALQVPAQAVAGSELHVKWHGPNRKDDQVLLVPVGTPDDVFQNSSSATLSAQMGKGILQTPATAGEYELRYGLAGIWFEAPVILARARLKVEPVNAQVHAPATCEAGATLALSWKGPNRKDDTVRLVPVGTADATSYPSLTVSAAAGSGTLRAPAEAGEYELRYALAGSAPNGPVNAGSWTATAAIVARAMLTVTPAKATFGDSDGGEAGSTIDVSWTGPNREDDEIYLVLATNSDDVYWHGLTFSAAPGSLKLRLPASPGDYELRYRLGGATLHGGAIIARATVHVTPAKAAISAPSSARAGAELKLSWSGPKRTGDELLLVPANARDDIFLHGFVVSAEKGHGNLRTPVEPGDYEIRYRLGGAAIGGSAIIGRSKVRLLR